MSRHHHAIGELAFGLRSFVALVEAPLLLAFRDSNFDGEFGWQLLVLLLLAIVALVSVGRRRNRRAALWPAAAACWLYLVWFMTAQQARFAVPALIAVTALASYGLQRFHGMFRYGLLGVLAILSLASIPWRNAAYYQSSWRTVLGTMSRADYVDIGTRLDYLPLVEAISSAVPGDAKLMLLFEHRGFYLSRRYVIGTPLFQAGPFTPPEQFSDPGRVMAALRQQQITHLVISKEFAGPDHAPDSTERSIPLLAALDTCIARGSLVPFWESDAYMIVTVR
jgi:hypothetical protein